MKTTKLKIGHKEQEFAVVESHGKELLLDISNGRLEVWADKFKNIEPDLLQFLSELTEDDTLYDVGASIGHFSVFAAMFAGKTYAFEPEAQNYSTASLNKFANSDRLKGELSIFNLALSDRMQIGNITIGSYGAGEHTKSIDRYSRYDHLTQTGDKSCVYSDSIMEIPMDEFVQMFNLPLPTCLKIDVDGAELAVLEGASSTLNHPAVRAIFIELEDDETGKACKERIESKGFVLEQEHEVARMRGGIYEGLSNYIFKRT